jgi:hypothetical protein
MGVQRPKYAMVGSWHRLLRRLLMFGVAFHSWQVVFNRIRVRYKRVCTVMASCRYLRFFLISVINFYYIINKLIILVPSPH